MQSCDLNNVKPVEKIQKENVISENNHDNVSQNNAKESDILTQYVEIQRESDQTQLPIQQQQTQLSLPNYELDLNQVFSLRSQSFSELKKSLLLTPMTRDVSKQLSKMHYSLSDDPNSYLFRKPVPQSIVGYSEVVKQPMDLSTVRQKLISNKYFFVEEFFSDLFMICVNCQAFNEASSLVFQSSQHLQNAIIMQIDQHFQYMKMHVEGLWAYASKMGVYSEEEQKEFQAGKSQKKEQQLDQQQQQQQIKTKIKQSECNVQVAEMVSQHDDNVIKSQYENDPQMIVIKMIKLSDNEYCLNNDIDKSSREVPMTKQGKKSFQKQQSKIDIIDNQISKLEQQHDRAYHQIKKEKEEGLKEQALKKLHIVQRVQDILKQADYDVILATVEFIKLNDESLIQPANVASII